MRMEGRMPVVAAHMPYPITGIHITTLGDHISVYTGDLAVYGFAERAGGRAGYHVEDRHL